jgi:hypothetical protein
MPTSHASHFSISLKMTFQKELKALPRIKPEIKISGISQDHGKSIGRSPGQTLLDPIDLNFLPGKKRQFMVSLPALMTVLLGIEGHYGITALILIGLQSLVDLRGF